MKDTPQTFDKFHGIFWQGEAEVNFLGHIVSEIYKEAVYNEFLPLDKKGKVALEIGGNIGAVSFFLSKYFEKVIVLEPSTEHFETLSYMIKFNKLDNVFPIKKALFTENGKFPFGGPDNNKTMRSLHMATWQDGKPQEDVETITLDRLFEDEKIDKVHFLKLDCEGSEQEILGSESFRKVAPKIDSMLIERHSWSSRHPHQLEESLKKAGFKVQTLATDADILVANRI